MKYISLILLLLSTSCTASRQTTETHKEKLSVSFFSRGSGIDYKKRGEFDSYIIDFQKNEHISLSVEQLKWGREGEVDYCIDLKSLSKSKQQKLITGTKQLLSASELIRITEKDVCKH